MANFNSDYLNGLNNGYLNARIAAFGAIRRAAEHARYCERRSADWKRNGVQDLADNAAFSADGIRRAIRAAIGSEKA